MMNEYLKEVTVWDSPVQNHTYIVTPGGWLAGYIKQGTTKEIIFKNPLKSWSKSYRKFQKVAKFGDQMS
jgi:hypothetical protein